MQEQNQLKHCRAAIQIEQVYQSQQQSSRTELQPVQNFSLINSDWF